MCACVFEYLKELLNEFVCVLSHFWCILPPCLPVVNDDDDQPLRHVVNGSFTLLKINKSPCVHSHHFTAISTAKTISETSCLIIFIIVLRICGKKYVHSKKCWLWACRFQQHWQWSYYVLLSHLWQRLVTSSNKSVNSIFFWNFYVSLMSSCS